MMDYLILAAICLNGACECYDLTVRPYTMVEVSPLQARNGNQSAYYEPCFRPSHGGPPSRADLRQDLPAAGTLDTLPDLKGDMVIGPIEEMGPDSSVHCNNCPEEDQQ